MWAFLHTPHPKANSSPVGGWTTWSGHSVPSSCLPLGPAHILKEVKECNFKTHTNKYHMKNQVIQRNNITVDK